MINSWLTGRLVHFSADEFISPRSGHYASNHILSRLTTFKMPKPKMLHLQHVTLKLVRSCWMHSKSVHTVACHNIKSSKLKPVLASSMLLQDMLAGRAHVKHPLQ